jgi:hypothetical protein
VLGTGVVRNVGDLCVGLSEVPTRGPVSRPGAASRFASVRGLGCVTAAASTAFGFASGCARPFSCLADGSAAELSGVLLAGSACNGAAAFCGLMVGRGLVSAAPRSGSRRTPRRKSLPSRRQFRATAEKCSRCHFTVSLEPTVMGVLIRMQAPEREVSSRVAGAWYGWPAGSSQQTSATAHMVVLGSMLRPSMPSVSAGWERSLVTSGWEARYGGTEVGGDRSGAGSRDGARVQARGSRASLPSFARPVRV